MTEIGIRMKIWIRCFTVLYSLIIIVSILLVSIINSQLTIENVNENYIYDKTYVPYNEDKGKVQANK